jgi:hypothetical protein
MNEQGYATSEIVARNILYPLLPEPYWHVTPQRGSNLLNNAYLGEVICWSISAIRASGLDGAVTLYGHLNQNRNKEAVWEQIRVERFPALPTRQHALFLFDDEAIANHARVTWFAGQDRVVVEARVVRNANLHRADATLLDGQPDQWESNAARYWRGEMTPAPRPEIVVEGAVYFPGGPASHSA